MPDLRTQRNLAFAAVLAAAAALVGFVVGRSPGAAGPSPVPAVAEPGLDPAEPKPAAPSATAAAPVAATPAPPRPGSVPSSPPPHEAPRRPAPSPPRVETLVVPDGTPISLALDDEISSQTSRPGDRLSARLTEPVEVGGRVALPSGTRIDGEVSEAVPLARIGGQARLALAFDNARVDGVDVPIAAYFARVGKSETGKDAATIAASAAIGIILGNQAKMNDRGKVIGGLAGAAAGTAIAAGTKGEVIVLPPGTELRLTLRGAVTVRR